MEFNVHVVEIHFVEKEKANDGKGKTHKKTNIYFIKDASLGRFIPNLDGIKLLVQYRN